MTGKKPDKRTRLVQTAAKLSHRHGFGNVSLANIAAAAKVPLGNIYYYFKTKAEVGEAIVEQRCGEFQHLRDQWETATSPKARLAAFVQMSVDNRDVLARMGCPVGSLSSELCRKEGSLATGAARPLRELLVWIEAQFAALGKGREKTTLAIHLLSAVQGVSLLAQAFRDPAIIVAEAEQLRKWINAL